MDRILAKTLAEATAALDFEIPLESNDQRYVDLGQARGTDVCKRLQTLLERQPADRWMHAVFASHRGAGKSTELKRLASAVSRQYSAVYFEANVEMDSVRFSMEDLLLVIARVIEEQMRKRGTPIPAAELKKVENWFAEVVLTGEQSRSFLAGVETEAKAEGGIPFVAKLLASLTASFKVESTHRESVKNTLRKFPGTLMTLVNDLLDAASPPQPLAGPYRCQRLVEHLGRTGRNQASGQGPGVPGGRLPASGLSIQRRGLVRRASSGRRIARSAEGR